MSPGLSRGHQCSARRLLTASLLLCAVVPPDASASFVLTKTTLSGGATAVAGGSFVLGATSGEAGVVGETSGGSYRLIEGFWLPNIGVPTSVDELPSDPTPASEAVRFVNAFSASRPNPFRETTSISFSVADPSPIELVIYDVSGRLVRTLVHRSFTAGRYQVSWDGRDEKDDALANGIYFARLTIGSWSAARTLMRLR